MKPMGAEQTTKIESCVLACLDQCRKSNRPFTRLSAFLESLKLHGWTDDEIIEVQRQVNRVLRDEHNSDGDMSDRSNR
jgi:hypothetical protein